MPWFRNLTTGGVFHVEDAEQEGRMRERRDEAGQPIFEQVEPPREDEFEFNPAEAP